MNTTPDGLIAHEQPGIGLVVSAAEHNHTFSKWQSERETLRRHVKELCEVVGDEYPPEDDRTIRATQILKTL